jgi:hypothetical protein
VAAPSSSTASNREEAKQARPAEKRIAHAVIHPIRLDSLCLMFEQVVSPKEIARILKKPLSTVSFHVGELVADDAIELVRTAQRRGAIEHYYRAKLRPEIGDEEMRALPRATRRSLASLILQGVVAEGLSSLRHGKMENDDELNLIWMPMRLGAEGREEVSTLQNETLERLEEIRQRDEGRDTDEGEKPTRIAALMWFERGQAGRPPQDAGATGD